MIPSQRVAVKQLFGKNWSASLVATRLYHPNSKEYVQPKVMRPLAYGPKSKQYEIMSHCLEHSVPLVGFNERAIVKSLTALDESSSWLSVLGSSNSPSLLHSSTAVMELLKFNLVDKRYKLVQTIPIDETTDKKELPSLQELLLRRLQMDAPIGPHLTQLMSQLSVPGPFLIDVALPELHQLSDDMIYFSNEKDHNNFAWYSKRMGVSLAYVSSKLFMAQDKSHNYSETMEFAKDRLNRIMTLGDYYNNAEEFAWFALMNTVNIARSKLAKG